MKRLLYLLLPFTALIVNPDSLLAEGPPSPYDQNDSGAFAGATMSFGQSRAVGESNPGVGWFMAGEAGYVSARQSWNRIEMSVEAGMGKASFKKKAINTQVDLEIDFFLLAKFGYAYSIGENSFGVIRLGAGPAMATYPAKAIVTSDTSEDITGFMALIGYDLVFPAGEGIELVVGIQNRITNFTGDKVDSFQMNIPGMNLGFRMNL